MAYIWAGTQRLKHHKGLKHVSLCPKDHENRKNIVVPISLHYDLDWKSCRETPFDVIFAPDRTKVLVS
mgnify:CR=1 FL=1